MTVLATINSEMICVGMGIDIAHLRLFNKGIVAGFIGDFMVESGFEDGSEMAYIFLAGRMVGNALVEKPK